MSIIKLCYTHDLPVESLRERLTEFGRKLELFSQAAIVWNPTDDNTLDIRGPSVDGYITIERSRLILFLRLGFTFRVAVDTIRKTFEREFEFITSPLGPPGQGPGPSS